jgi:hypothetical protein
MPRLRRHKFASFRPAIELLESRWVPTTLTPTTFADGGLGSGSLRDAVLQFNADTGTDDDIIQLSAGTYHLTIPNAGSHHETAGLTGDLNLTQTSHRWIIQGAGYTGTVSFSTSDTDPGVVLPADYAFTLGDGGSHTFTDTGLGETTLITPGDQILTVMDTAGNTITGSATITVNSGPGPAPHEQGPPPSTLQPSPVQGEAPTRSEPSANEVVAAERWFVSIQPTDQGSATFKVTLNGSGSAYHFVADVGSVPSSTALSVPSPSDRLRHGLWRNRIEGDCTE